jgi:hypothetical protein
MTKGRLVLPLEWVGADPRSQKRDPPNVLYVILDRTACAPFYTERRIKCAEPTELRRKSGDLGHPSIFTGRVVGLRNGTAGPPRHCVLGNFQPSPFGRLRAGSSGLKPINEGHLY